MPHQQSLPFTSSSKIEDSIMGLIKTGLMGFAAYGVAKKVVEAKEEKEQHDTPQQPQPRNLPSGYRHQDYCNGQCDGRYQLYCGRQCGGQCMSGSLAVPAGGSA